MIWVVTAETVVLVLITVVLVGLLRSHAEVLRSLHDLGVHLDPDDGDHVVGGRAPAARPPRTRSGRKGVTFEALDGATPEGGVAHVALAGAGAPTLVAFLSTGCATCALFWDALAAGTHEGLDGAPDVVVVTGGPDRENPRAVADLTPPGVRVLMSSQEWERHEVPVVPYFRLVDTSGGVAGEGTASSWEQLVGLVRRAAEGSGPQ